MQHQHELFRLVLISTLISGAHLLQPHRMKNATQGTQDFKWNVEPKEVLLYGRHWMVIDIWKVKV